MTGPILELATSPHVTSGRRVDVLMRDVVLALLPTTAFAVYSFGLAAAAVLLTAVVTCVFVEHLFCLASGKPTTVGDWSAVITGLLFGLTLPPTLPLWMVAVGSALCIALGKQVFGGLGMNPFNPALIGRTVLQATFPVPMTTWIGVGGAERFTSLPASLSTPPFTAPVVDVVTTATPLAAFKFEQRLTDVGDLALGFTAGSVGETSALLILLGGVWLVARRVMSWRIVAAVLGTVALLSAGLHGLDPERYAPPLFMLCSGGLMLGAVFMATDLVGSPMTNLGCWIYGALIGALVVVIRVWGGMPEGVMYAVLLGNAITPHIDRLVRPRVYGTRARSGAP